MKQFIILKGGEVDVSGAPEVISVLPLGHVVSSKGEFNVDAESFEAMKQMIAQRGVDLVIDYEHQTLAGVQAPAAGWVKELILRDGSIEARVEWTPTATKYLENKEYRYLSPVISVRKTDGKAMGLHSLALTNTPAIEGMAPIVNSLNYKEDKQTMDIIQKIAQMLGLGEGATEEQVLEAIKTFFGELQTLKGSGESNTGDTVVANKAVCELLGLKAGAAADEVVTKIMSLKGGNIDGVNVLEELKALKQQSAEREANDAVVNALKGGKITPAQKDWAVSYALSDSKGFASFIEKAPQIVPMDSIVLDDGLQSKSSKPDEATMLACKQLGLTPEEIEKYGKEQ